jgi:hypothetical protein
MSLRKIPFVAPACRAFVRPVWAKDLEVFSFFPTYALRPSDCGFDR